ELSPAIAENTSAAEIASENDIFRIWLPPFCALNYWKRCFPAQDTTSSKFFSCYDECPIGWRFDGEWDAASRRNHETSGWLAGRRPGDDRPRLAVDPYGVASACPASPRPRASEPYHAAFLPGPGGVSPPSSRCRWRMARSHAFLRCGLPGHAACARR